MKILIYGAGAMGASLGVMLTKGGVDCTLVTRNVRSVFAFSREGVTLVSGTHRETIPVNVLLPHEMIGEYDLVFLATKQRENETLAPFLAHYLAADGALVTVQNGLPERSLAKVFGADRVYGAALAWGAEQTGEGELTLTSKGGFRLALGAYGRGARISEIRDLLKRAAVVETGNLLEIRYSKLAINATFSTLSLLYRCSYGEVVKKHRGEAMKLLKEVFAVAKAAGVKRLPLNGHNLYKVFGVFGRMLMPIAMKKYYDIRSGMLKDFEAGRRTDIDFVAGAVVAEGERLLVPTPHFKNVLGLIHEAEESR